MQLGPEPDMISQTECVPVENASAWVGRIYAPGIPGESMTEASVSVGHPTPSQVNTKQYCLAFRPYGYTNDNKRLVWIVLQIWS